MDWFRVRSAITRSPYAWYAAFCVGGLAIWSLIANIGQRHYLYESALTFVAQFFYIGSVFLGLGLGIFIGIKVAAAGRRTWLGWVIGIAACVAVIIGAREIAKEIPDVGWRIKAIESYEPLE